MSKKNKTMYLLGKDISHSFSPKLYNEYFANHNIDIEYKLLDTDNIEKVLSILTDDNTFAFNVTMPFKTKILKYLEAYDENVSNANSANLVINQSGRFIGYNSDGIGFFNSLINNGINIKGKNLTIIGHGGAGKSITSLATKFGISKVNIITHKLNDDITNPYTCKTILDMLLNADILVNATYVGFSNNNDMPLNENILEAFLNNKTDFVFVDIIYNPSETPLLRFMRECGVKKTFNGEIMLKAQFEENLRILRL